jgi:ribosomal protein S18 acetylase RimI-like enzyme
VTSVSADIVVRRLEAADWPVLKAARLAALTDAPEAFASTLEHELDYTDEQWQEWLASTAATFGAFRTGEERGPAAARIAGMAAARVRPRPDQPGEHTEWRLMSVWLSPDLRGTGIAARLVDAMREQARRSGADLISLWVTDANERARAFYIRLGFEPTGRHQLMPEQPDHWETELAQPLN